MSEQLLTLPEVAARLRWHEATFRKRRRQLEATGFPLPWDDPTGRRALLWRACEIDRWIAGRGGRLAADPPPAATADAEPDAGLSAAELAAARATLDARADRLARNLAHIGDRR